MNDWNICYWIDYSWKDNCLETFEIDQNEFKSISKWQAHFTDKVVYNHQFRKEVDEEWEKLYYLWKTKTLKEWVNHFIETVSTFDLAILKNWGYILINNWVEELIESL